MILFAGPVHMTAETDAGNGGLAEQLGMGSAVYLSKHVSLASKKVKGEA